MRARTTQVVISQGGSLSITSVQNSSMDKNSACHNWWTPQTIFIPSN